MKLLTVISISAIMLFTTACTPSSQIQVLNGIVAAVDMALPIISAAYPGTIPPGVSTYLDSVLNAVSTVSTELATNDAPTHKAAVITQQLAALATVPNIPGVSPQVQLILRSVASAVSAFVSPYLNASNAMLAHADNMKVKISYADRQALGNIHSRAVALKSKLSVKR